MVGGQVRQMSIADELFAEIEQLLSRLAAMGYQTTALFTKDGVCTRIHGNALAVFPKSLGDSQNRLH